MGKKSFSCERGCIVTMKSQVRGLSVEGRFRFDFSFADMVTQSGIGLRDDGRYKDLFIDDAEITIR